MSLDVYIHSSLKSSPFPLQGQYVLSFDDDEGDYWFLWPLFKELASRTGQGIDLYGEAVFGGTDLVALAQTIEAARDLTDAQPENWNVSIGRTTGASGTDIFVPVNKQKLLSLLNQLQLEIEKASQHNHFVVFWGD